MHTGRTIFAQVMDFLPLAEFRACIARYHGEYKVRGFSCLDPFLCLAFAQLTYRESLRDIETCLWAMQPKKSRPRKIGQAFKWKLCSTGRRNLTSLKESRQ